MTETTEAFQTPARGVEYRGSSTGLSRLRQARGRVKFILGGAQAVIEGKYTAPGVFEATSLLLKCPPKYAEE